MNCLELQELLALDALELLDRPATARLQALLDADLDAKLEAPRWRDAVAAFAAAASPRRTPPASLRERILTQISRTQQAPAPGATPAPTPSPKAPPTPPHPTRPAMRFDFAREAEWRAIPNMPGVLVRILALNAAQGYRVVQVELQPGASFPEHHHGRGPEDLFLISGDLLTEGRTLHAGDHFHAEPGTDHQPLMSPSGCQALIIEPLAGPQYLAAAVA